MLIEQAFPDLVGGEPGFLIEPCVDGGPKRGEDRGRPPGAGISVSRTGRGQCLQDSPAWHLVACCELANWCCGIRGGVAADRVEDGEISICWRWRGFQDCRGAGPEGVAEPRERVLERCDRAAGDRGEQFRLDAPAGRAADKRAQVARPQVVGAGEPPDIRGCGFAVPGPDRDRQRCQRAAGHVFFPGGLRPASAAMSTSTASRVFLVTASVPSRTAWTAAERTSRSRLPIIPRVRW